MILTTKPSKIYFSLIQPVLTAWRISLRAGSFIQSKTVLNISSDFSLLTG